MQAMILLTGLVLSPAVWAAVDERMDASSPVVLFDEMKSLKDKDAVMQSRLAQAAQKLDKIRTDLTPRYVKLLEAAQKEFARLRNEANLDQYVTMLWKEKYLQEYELKDWNRFQAEKPDFSHAQNTLLTTVSKAVAKVQFMHLQGTYVDRAQMLVEKIEEAGM